MFWKEVNKIKSESKDNLQRIMNGDGNYVINETDVKRVWKEHFESLHNFGSNE